MAIFNPFEISYGSRYMGGALDDYLLSGPYVLDKTFENIRVVFDVVVVATSYADLENKSRNLEDDLRKRDQDLRINLNASDSAEASLFVYTFGDLGADEGILNSKATIAKTGDELTDRGLSRSYTVTVEGELPADDSTTGLRDLAWVVSYEAGGQRNVMMRGTYTSLGGSTATVLYQHANGAATEQTTFLAALAGPGGSANKSTYEMVDESYAPDRTGHVVTFERQFVELLVNQSQGVLDNTNIFDHSLRFVEMVNQPGDSGAGLHRLRRVVGTYDCAINIASTATDTDIQTAFTDTVRPHVIALFETTFSPQVFAVEDSRAGYDETSKRMSVTIQILYQPPDGGAVVELQQSIAIRELRNLDKTPVHDKQGFAAYVDAGWDEATRVSTRTLTAVGFVPAVARLDRKPVSSGWQVESNVSQSEQKYIGDPTSNNQILLTILNDTVVETFSSRPGAGSGGIISNYTPGGETAGGRLWDQSVGGGVISFGGRREFERYRPWP